MQVPDPLARYFTVHFLRPFTQRDVLLEWDPRLPELSAARQALEDHFWQTYREQNESGHIYDGLICELREYFWQHEKLRLRLGPLPFKSHLFSWMKGRPATEELPGGPRLGLGVSAVVISSDRQILFMKRSRRVAAAPGRFDVFGGHIDPERHRNDQRTGAPPDPFRAIAGELEEELNVSLPESPQLVGLGLVANRFNGQPELVFLCSPGLPAGELVRRALRAVDRGEYSHIIRIPDDPARLEVLLRKHAADFSPSGLASLWVYLQTKMEKGRA